MSLDRRQRIISVFILVWLTLQAAVPFVRKFDLPRFRYRHARFSWAMYSGPSISYQVLVYKVDKSGKEAPVPGLRTFVGLHTLAPHERRVHYYSPWEIEADQALLLRHLVERAADDDEYVVRIHWVRVPGAALPEDRMLSLSKTRL